MGLLFGLGCLAILLRQVDIRQSWNALGRLRGPFLLVPLALFLVNLPLRAWRWQLIFPSASRPGLGSCLTVLGIGNMANFLLPGRAGDVARCALVGQAGSLEESSRTLATLAVEKVMDGLALIGMVLFAAWALHPPHWVLDLLRVAVLIFGGALVMLVVLRYRTRALIDFVRRTFRRLHLSALEEKFDDLLSAFADGLSAISSAARMLTLLLITAVIWTTEAAAIWGLAGALGLAVHLQSAVIASAILGLGLMIPAAPGGLGTYELFGTEAFKLAGIGASSALALTVVIHAWVFVANVIAGVALLAMRGLSLAQLRNRLAADQPAEAAGSGSTIRPSV
ncbi:MAG TPA: lysylphosphatidylglycerol synthase transmembrane domain-containing protein [Candidatus Dormibacteraeota bacterium]|nr:lysylphosphatidylglycerol synthase transmembrane domain-containing protein [Candidatus Dormibacteraeota bacterium]